MDGPYSYFFCLSTTYVFFTENQIKDLNFFNILKSKQVEYVCALCNLKNNHKKRLQPCEKKISIDWQRWQSAVVVGVLPSDDVALYYYW